MEKLIEKRNLFRKYQRSSIAIRINTMFSYFFIENCLKQKASELAVKVREREGKVSSGKTRDNFRRDAKATKLSEPNRGGNGYFMESRLGLSGYSTSEA